jgi:hypothetical protein
MSHDRRLPLFAAALLAASAFAQLDPCAGNQGGFAAALGTPVAGATVPLTLTGPPNAPYFFALSDALVPTPAPPFGTSCVDFASPSFQIVFSGALPGNGVFAVPLAVPGGPFFASFVAFGQGAAFSATAPGGLAISPLVRFDFAPGNSFEPAGVLSAARNFATATTFPGDVVFVTGGKDGGLLESAAGPTAQTSLWFKTSRASVAGPPMSTPRFAHTATLLLDGRVLIAGGAGGAPGFVATTSCEIYDPSTNAFTAVGSLGHARVGHAAALLPDGRVLVAGGCANLALSLQAPLSMTAFNTARDDGEIFDPSTGQWTPVPNVTQAPRVFGAATTLADGRPVFVSGICGTYPLAGSLPPIDAATGSVFTDAFDPATGLFTALPSIVGIPLAGSTAAVLPDGRLWLAGGATVNGASMNPFATSATALFDGVQWSMGPSLGAGTVHHRVATLADGTVHVSGGAGKLFDGVGTSGSTACATYDGTTFAPAAAMSAGRYGHAVATLSDGTLLLIGGRTQNATGGGPGSGIDELSCTLYVPAP